MVGEVVDATAVGQTGTGDAGTSSEGQAPKATLEPQASTVDWDSDDNPWKGEAKKHRQRADSIEGTARKATELDTHLVGLRLTQQEIVKYLTDPDADPVKFRQAVNAQQSISAEELRNTGNKMLAADYLEDITAKLTSAGVSPDDERVKEASALWNEAGGSENPQDMRMLGRAYRMALDVAATTEKEALQKEIEAARAEAKAAESRFKIEGGLLDGANPRGTVSGTQSLEDLTKPLPRTATLKDIKEREEALNAAMGLSSRR